MNCISSLKNWFPVLALVAGGALLLPETLTAQKNTLKMELNAHQQLTRAIFSELIGMNTTLNMGSTKAAEAMARRLKEAGFDNRDLLIDGPQPDHKNLVVRYRGTGKSRPVLFIGHLDVVEALREDWTLDPFTLTEKDGYFYGRGTTDMKSEDAILVANLIRMKKEGFTPDRDLIVALTDHEENGDCNGVKWLVNNRRELIDAEYCVNPDGGGGEIRNGKPAVMTIQTSEKVYIDYTFEVKNKGGHSAQPVLDNAIYHLSEALLKVADYNFPIMLNETTRLFFERSALMESGQTKTDMLAMGKEPLDLEAANRLAKLSPLFNSKMRTTCVATMLSGGHAENALPQTARANVNCRMLPDDNLDNVTSTLKRIVADTVVHVTCHYASVISPRSEIRTDVLEALENITASMWPGVIVTPVMSSGATDGKYLRAAGIPVFGISGVFAGDDNRAHGRDERVGVKEFFDGAEFMFRMMKTLSK